MGKVNGKVAIVTGAARGLGWAYAKRLAGLGAMAAVTDLNLRSYEEFETEAKDMTADSNGRRDRGGSTNGIEVDVAHHEAVDAMVAQVVREWGRYPGREYRRRSRLTHGYEGEHPRSGTPTAGCRDEPFGTVTRSPQS